MHLDKVIAAITRTRAAPRVLLLMILLLFGCAGRDGGQGNLAPTLSDTAPAPGPLPEVTHTVDPATPTAPPSLLPTNVPTPTSAPATPGRQRTHPFPQEAETLAAARLDASRLPYPRSPVIQNIRWNFERVIRAAAGSDLFPLTWADDGHLYTTWGDGWGFAESGSKRFLGVSSLMGDPAALTAQDLWSGVGKSHGIISVDGALYLLLTEQGAWMRAKIGRSTDHGLTWTFDPGWTFSEPGGAFAGASFLQFGQDYAGARDSYVYGYSERVRGEIQPDVVLFRAPKERLMERAAYEFFAGLDDQGEPQWTADVNAMQPVLSDPNGVTWGMQAMYHPVLHRYLLTVRQKDTGSGWALFDAPEPWGPWTTVAYYDHWLDGVTKIMYSFNQKWMSVDGLSLWMIFSGLQDYDSFNAVQADLELW